MLTVRGRHPADRVNQGGGALGEQREPLLVDQRDGRVPLLCPDRMRERPTRVMTAGRPAEHGPVDIAPDVRRRLVHHLQQRPTYGRWVVVPQRLRPASVSDQARTADRTST